MTCAPICHLCDTGQHQHRAHTRARQTHLLASRAQCAGILEGLDAKAGPAAEAQCVLPQYLLRLVRERRPDEFFMAALEGQRTVGFDPHWAKARPAPKPAP